MFYATSEEIYLNECLLIPPICVCWMMFTFKIITYCSTILNLSNFFKTLSCNLIWLELKAFPVNFNPGYFYKIVPKSVYWCFKPIIYKHGNHEKDRNWLSIGTILKDVNIHFLPKNGKRSHFFHNWVKISENFIYYVVRKIVLKLW